MRVIGLRQRWTYTLIFLLSTIIPILLYTVIRNEVQRKSQLSSPSLSGDTNSVSRLEGTLKSHKHKPQHLEPIKYCRAKSVSKLLKLYSQKWKKQADHLSQFRSLLNKKCSGTIKAIVTQANTPLGSTIIYDGDRKRSTKVTSKLFSTFVKDSPFLNKTFKTCAVVGNGGVLANSSCGKNIDLAQFVIRCNLGSLDNGYEKHVGKKTNLISSNPSILTEHYGALIDYRRPFVNRLDPYKNALFLLPAFSYWRDTAVSLRAYYTLNDFDSSIQAVFYNPEYLLNLAEFWRGRGLKTIRLSTGMMMVSLAVEMCSDIQVYGFWPFPVHPNDCRPIANHYYDNRPWRRKFHAMPDEFRQLLRLHNMGVLKLHLGRCIPGGE